MSTSRSKKALKNASCELLLEVVTAICSFILPRLILTHFGSAYNGITASITQFIGCVALLKSGIGSVTRAALYKPLAEGDPHGISEVVGATERFMRRIALIFTGCVLVFAAVYPLFVAEDFDWFFSFTLVLILSVSTVAQYYFGLTYQMVLQADQCNYIISLVNIGTTVANTAISAVLILVGCNIHVVKLGSAVVFVVPAVFYMIFVRRRYKIDRSVPPNTATISQRWDALGHQLASFMTTNTDIIIITIALGVAEVSVYTIYYMVANAVKKVITAVSSGIMAAFGNIMARGEEKLLQLRFRQYEFFITYLSTLLFTVTALLLLPFVRIYTAGITDVNYMRLSFAVLVCVAEYFGCLKIPYQEIIYAAGKFKETKLIAYAEAGVHLVVSVVLVIFIGLDGVIIGTILAMALRMVWFSLYVSKNIVKRAALPALAKPLVYSAICATGSVLAAKWLVGTPSGYLEWILTAIPVTLIAFGVTTLVALLGYRKELLGLIKTIFGMLRRSKKQATPEKAASATQSKE